MVADPGVAHRVRDGVRAGDDPDRRVEDPQIVAVAAHLIDDSPDLDQIRRRADAIAVDAHHLSQEDVGYPQTVLGDSHLPHVEARLRLVPRLGRGIDPDDAPVAIRDPDPVVHRERVRRDA
jgi:hypothetical protein